MKSQRSPFDRSANKALSLQELAVDSFRGAARPYGPHRGGVVRIWWQPKGAIALIRLLERVVAPILLLILLSFASGWALPTT